MKKIIVAYLSSGFVEIKSLKKFLQNYKKFSPGYHHEIIICFKKLDDFTCLITKLIFLCLKKTSFFKLILLWIEFFSKGTSK